MLNTRGLSSHRTGVESLLSHPKGSMHNRKGGGKNEYQGNMDNNFIDFVKGKVKMGNTDSTVDWYAVSRVLSTILHIFGAILVLYYWGNAAGDARKAPLLKTNAFFTTDYSSMMDTIANTGMVPLPSTGSMSMAYTIAAHAEPGMKALTQLDKSGMLSRAQPVMIRSRTGNSSAFVPDRCTVIALVDKDGVAIPGESDNAPGPA